MISVRAGRVSWSRELEQVPGGAEADACRSGAVAVVLEDLAGLFDQVGDAGAGDFEQVGQDVHGAGLPLVDQGELQAGGVVEQRLATAEATGGATGPAAAFARHTAAE